jgi:hypothetical protein
MADQQSMAPAVAVSSAAKSSMDGTSTTRESTVVADATVTVKSEPPKFVRREKRSTSGDGVTITRRGDIIAQQQQQRRPRRQSGESPTAVGRAERTQDSGDECRYDGGDELTTTDSDDRSPTMKTASDVPISDQLAMTKT